MKTGIICLISLALLLLLGKASLAYAQQITYSPAQPSNAISRNPLMCSPKGNDTAYFTQDSTEHSSMNSDFCLSVPVLLYHHIEPQSEARKKGQVSLNVDPYFFDMHLKYLRDNGYTFLTAEELVNSLKTHTVLPSKSVVITIDDGYKDNFLYAFPIAQKYGGKINLALAAGLMGEEDFMSWGDLIRMKESRIVSFMNHTWSHYAVSGGLKDKIESEIVTGKRQIEQNLNQNVNVFVYPYGSYGQTAIEVLGNNGFIGAFSTVPGFVQCESYVMTLHRTHVGNAPLSSYGL